MAPLDSIYVHLPHISLDTDACSDSPKNLLQKKGSGWNEEGGQFLPEIKFRVNGKRIRALKSFFLFS